MEGNLQIVRSCVLSCYMKNEVMTMLMKGKRENCVFFFFFYEVDDRYHFLRGERGAHHQLCNTTYTIMSAFSFSTALLLFFPVNLLLQISRFFGVYLGENLELPGTKPSSFYSLSLGEGFHSVASGVFFSPLSSMRVWNELLGGHA